MMMEQVKRSILFTSHQTEIDFRASEPIKRSAVLCCPTNQKIFLNKIFKFREIYFKQKLKEKLLIITEKTFFFRKTIFNI